MSRIKLYLIFCLINFFAVSITAQKQIPPAGDKPKDFKLPQKETIKLENGLQATLVPYGVLPKVTIRVVVRVGNLNEGPDEIWLCDLTGDLMKEGTTSLQAREVALKAAGMGGEVNISVGPDQTWIGGSVLSEFAPDLINLLADIVQNPLLPESELDRLKRDMIRSLMIQKSQPRSLALEKFRAILYPDHPYGRIFPTTAMIQSYNINRVRNFYQANFGAARTHIYVVGRFDASAVKAAIRRAFNNWTPGKEPLILLPSPRSGRAVYLIDRPGAHQSTIYMGLPVVDPSHEDYMPLIVMNTLLGGAFASRITSNIREDKGYTYSPYSQVSTRYRDAYWVQVADVTTAVTGPAIKEIFYEIDRLRSEPPGEEELKGTQNYMAGTFILRNSTPSGIIGQLAFLDLHGLSDEFLTNYVKNIFSVTPEEVQKVAHTYLKDEEMTIVIVGDRKNIEGQIVDYGQLIP